MTSRFTHTALIIVDMQNDFVLGGGSLPVPGAAEITGKINAFASKLKAEGATIVATKDWHPQTHCSFKANGGLWPRHCVQDGFGAELVGDLDTKLLDAIIHKGSNVDHDSYSGFKDDNSTYTGLSGYLTEKGISEVYVCGLALDYCVKATARDAADYGFETTVIADLTRAVDPAFTADKLNDGAGPYTTVEVMNTEDFLL